MRRPAVEREEPRPVVLGVSAAAALVAPGRRRLLMGGTPDHWPRISHDPSRRPPQSGSPHLPGSAISAKSSRRSAWHGRVAQRESTTLTS